jgi:hypothetical protein
MTTAGESKRDTQYLDGRITADVCGPLHDWKSWTFGLAPGERHHVPAHRDADPQEAANTPVRAA